MASRSICEIEASESESSPEPDVSPFIFNHLLLESVNFFISSPEASEEASEEAASESPISEPESTSSSDALGLEGGVGGFTTFFFLLDGAREALRLFVVSFAIVKLDEGCGAEFGVKKRWNVVRIEGATFWSLLGSISSVLGARIDGEGVIIK